MRRRRLEMTMVNDAGLVRFRTEGKTEMRDSPAASNGKHIDTNQRQWRASFLDNNDHQWCLATGTEWHVVATSRLE